MVKLRFGQFVLTFCLVIIAALPLACGKRDSNLSKRVSVRGMTAHHAVFQRLQRAYGRRDLNATMDCLDGKSLRGYRQAEVYLVELFRHADKLMVSLKRGLVRESSAHKEYELIWERRYFDIYDRKEHVKRGRTWVTLPKGTKVPRIIAMRGDKLFAP